MARRCQEREYKVRVGGQEQRPGGTKGKSPGVETHRAVKFDAHFGALFSLQYNFDGTELAAGFSGGGIILYNAETGEKIRELRPHRHGGFPVMCLRYHPSEPNVLYAGTAEGHLYIINTETGDGAQTQTITEEKNEINTMDFSVDNRLFATSGKDLGVRIYSTKTCKLVKEYKGITQGATNDEPNLEWGNTKRVFCLRFSPEKEDIFLTSGWSDNINIWDSNTNDGIKRQIHGAHVCGEALDMKGYTILAGSWRANNALQEYDYREGKLIQNLNFPHKDGAFLYCAQYANDNTVLAGGSGTKSVEVMDSRANKHVGGVKMNKVVMSLDSAKEGQLFAVGGEENVLKMCKME